MIIVTHMLPFMHILCRQHYELCSLRMKVLLVCIS